MRKLFAVVLTVILGSMALAEGLDFSSMSTDELLDMQKAIDNELSDRGLELDVITRGSYPCGVGIKPGMYVLSFYEADKPDKGAAYVVYDSEDKFVSHGRVKEGEPVTVSIIDGYRLWIGEGSCYIQPIKPSFAP